MTPAKIHEFHKLFAMWFYSTGMAFNKAAHHTLAAALRLLTPSDIVPTRQQLAGDLLNVCYDDFRSKMILKIANRRCTVVADTWTDINGNAVINYVLVFEDMTVFFESVYSGSDSHDAPYLASDIERVMAKLSFVTVAAVVTDNTATNQLAWSKLQQKHPKIFFHGCISHALHLTVKDLVQCLPWLGKLEENCRKLVRFFEKNQQLWYELKNMKPPSDVYRMFLELPEQFIALSIPISDLGKIRQILKERFDFIYGDAHGVTYLLDPRYLGQNMDDGTREQVQSFITQWYGSNQEEAVLLELLKYLGTAAKQSFPLLRDITLTVFSASCSSAAGERNFSAHQFVHYQARNRFQDAPVEKLVFLFFNAKNFDNEDMPFYEMIDDLADASDDEDSSNEDSDFEYTKGRASAKTRTAT
ncbi:hypothetical protein PC129_g936 [Phytophthora cactorum]|uniref:DUF659 domain-containing protein n=2 Tax=Phytophthora cactorum TaxID=29920 RepID=A0A8T1IXR2_9STRA|nr:hypothetical protein Pcac1_g26105 [Phytophthora cactorum]KAG2843672.1 hypothetical protein PC112_g2506 [Phytophthora cactorum]KAG2927863.1 hypothetical protein PC114_g3322 [Phytophthora cactorum]KAG2951997.1 hypothetical protein PC117_g3145 [Phytophthora cactorum]KAG3039722.1 hypothetical protein PC119_g2011 [Phytophthora cactorum]